MGLWGTLIGGGISLFGAGQAKKEAQKNRDQQQQWMNKQEALQREALQMQRQALAPLQSTFMKTGLPGYQAGLQGLMSSYGYRPNAEPSVNPAAGTSIGQPPKPVPSFDEYIAGRADVNPNNIDARARAALTNDYNGVISQIQSENQIAQLNAGVPQLDFSGTWGYSGNAGRELGGITDKYNTARMNLQKRAQTEGLPPALVEAAMNRLDMAEAQDNRNTQLDALRQGPAALLNAIQPAFGMGAQAAQIAQGGAQNMISAGASMGNLANSPMYNTPDYSQGYQQLGQALGMFFDQMGKRKATAPAGAGAIPPVQGSTGIYAPQGYTPPPTMNPTPVMQQTQGLAYAGSSPYMNANDRAALARYGGDFRRY